MGAANRWKIVCACLAAMCVIPLSGCGSNPGGDKLSIISPHTIDIRENLVPLFEKWYREKTGRDVEVEWLNVGGSSDALRFIRAEYGKSPSGIKVDMFWGGGISPYITLKKEGLLQVCAISPDILKAIPTQLNGVPLYDQDGMWYGSCLSTFGIMVNKTVCDRHGLPAVKTWEDLTNPRYFGWVGAADPRHAGTTHVAFDIILQGYGWARGWRTLTLIAANMRRFNISSKDVAKDLVAGDVGLAFSVDYYAWKEIELHGAANVGFVVPEGGSMVNPDCFGILKGAPHAAAAKMFIEFILSEPTQKMWMLTSGQPDGPPVNSLYRLAVRPDVYPAVEGRTRITVNPFEAKPFLKYDAARSERLWEFSGDLMGVVLVDGHDELMAAWEKVVKAGSEPGAVDTLARVPVTEAQALDLALSWKDQKLRNDTIGQWQRFVRERYASAVKQGQ